MPPDKTNSSNQDAELLQAKPVALSFVFHNQVVFDLPLFVLVNRANQLDPNFAESVSGVPFDEMSLDSIAELPPAEQAPYIARLTETVPFDEVISLASCPDALKEVARSAWGNSPRPVNADPGFQIRRIPLPEMLYRYFSWDELRMRRLLEEGQLFLSCPAMFNDPFDCALDDDVRMAFLETGVCCFSSVRNSVLMFSHYGDKHAGVCIGFKRPMLLTSLASNTMPGVHPSIRKVWYFRNLPPFDLLEEEAFCATCKHASWAYEDEFRLFMVSGRRPLPSATFSFDKTAIGEIIFGCKTPEYVMAAVKTLTQDHSCDYFYATKAKGNFGLDINKVHRF